MPASQQPQFDEFDRQMRDRGLYVRGDLDLLSMRSDSIDRERRSFEAVVATETPALMRDYQTWQLIDEVLVARGGRFPSQIPLLNSHSRYTINDQLGSARDFRLEGEAWVGRGFVGRAVQGNTDREQVWLDIEDGHIRAVSIGYRVSNFVDIPAGKSQEVNGRRFKAGSRTLRVSTAWEVHELSVVSVGADSMALIRSRAIEAAQPRRSFFR